MAEYHQDYYANLLENNQPGFLTVLNRSIIKGDNSKEDALKMLEVASHSPLCQQLLFKFRDTYDDCMIHNVAKFHQSTNVLKYLLKICPKSALAERTDRFLGQTALHIVVTKQNLKATRAILKSVDKAEDLKKLLHVKAVGSLFDNTVMMGQLALSVAALTLNNSIVDLLIKHGAEVSAQNSKGDTVFHSLIRFSVIHPEKLDSIMNMIKHINSKLSSDLVSAVWYNAENSDNLTALKLAAALGQDELFSSILKMEDVYCKLNHHDGLFDVYLFDITEIDTITQAEWERNKTRGIKKGAESIFPAEGKNFSFNKQLRKMQPAAQSHRPALIHACPSVLDIICRLPTATAFRLMNVDVVSDLIKTKWRHYRKFYYLWFLLHFFFMSLITAYAVYKTDVINDRIYSDKTNGSQSDPYKTSDTTERFVFGTSLLCVVYAAPYLIYEAFRTFYFKQSWHLDVIHHNGLYRLMLLTLSVSLVIDSVLFWIDPDNNYFLIVALLIGWTFMNFFLRALKIFSFFTVMLQKVLLGDMTRFSVIIIFQLIAFSFAMYITFLNTNPVPDGFENIGMTILTMFKLMLGLTDIEILYDARHSWMAIFLFISCVLVTYVLLINSLIALMSQTCALVSEDRRMQWELQRLSVIHLVETMLFPRWRYLHKPGLKARRYNLHNQALEWRCFHEITSIQTTYTDGAAIFRRKSMIRTIGFEDSGISPMAPFIDRFRVGRTGNINSLSPIYQNPGSMRGVGTIAEENDELEQDSSDDEMVIPSYKLLRTVPTQIAVTDNINESSSDKASSKGKQTKLHSSNDNLKGSALDELKNGRMNSDENLFMSSSTLSNIEKDSNTTASRSSKREHKVTEHIKIQQQQQQQHLKPESTPKAPPRKRHNSETVNRKTQTVSQGELSHSYPDSGLRAPLRQNRSNLGDPPLTQPFPTPDNNPRFVYVVPSSALTPHQIMPNLNHPSSQLASPQDDQLLQQIAALPEIRFHQADSHRRAVSTNDNNYTQLTKPGSVTLASSKSDVIGHEMSSCDQPNVRVRMLSDRTDDRVGRTTKTVQKLDIDTLHSSA